MTNQTMQALLDKQRASFIRDGYPSIATRLDRLNRLENLIHENMPALCQAMSDDFGHRSAHQSQVADMYASLESIKQTKKNLARWMKPEKRKSPMPLGLLGARSQVIYQPKGVIGNITTWNFPVFVAITPLAGILAAGNRCMVKLTEVTPKTSDLLQQLFSQYFDETEVVGITGDVQVGADFSSLPLDHIIFTGATSVARYILEAAAKNLTPVTLELGGKSPVIIGRSANLAETALRIFAGKALNVGQVCISPDYVFVAEEQLDNFIRLANEQIQKMFPTMLNNPDYSSIVNERHYQRIQSYIEDSKQKGNDVREINPANEDFNLQKGTHKLPLTLIINPSEDSLVMQNEIFGPVVCIKTYKDVQETLNYINNHPRPLALYYFGQDEKEKQHILHNTTSGNVTINDVIAHAGVEDIPFGGIGPSGMGNYHGFDGFKTFSHAKGVFSQSKMNMMKLSGMIPPYGEKTERTLAFMLKRK